MYRSYVEENYATELSLKIDNEWKPIEKAFVKNEGEWKPVSRVKIH